MKGKEMVTFLFCIISVLITYAIMASAIAYPKMLEESQKNTTSKQ